MAEHWADQYAMRLIHERKSEKFVCAAGITPSGTIHIGNFREIITAELISRALKEQGKTVRYIYSWDDFDVFRKVPKNMPKQDVLQEHLRMPITETPDTHGCHDSFAEHNEAKVMEELPHVGIKPEFIRQSVKYKNCDYAKEINQCLQRTEEIKEILNEYRKDPLADEWLPVAIFCEKCRKDTIEKIEYRDDYKVYYECSCGHSEEFDFRKKGIIKLKWRVDWPMRWHYESVDCEPAGKDHFAAGGARESGVKIQKAIWDEEAPFGFMYEWIGIKGGKQFSSSTGDVIALADMLEIYEPEIVRYLFASTRPNSEFAISFDLDVIKIYEDYDKLERVYYGVESVSEKKLGKLKRIYELSSVSGVADKMLFQAPFRHLTNMLQIYNYNMDRTVEYYDVTGADKQRLLNRAANAKNWIEKYAPEDFKFSLDDTDTNITDEQKKVLIAVADILNKEWTDKELHAEFYEIARQVNIEPVELFRAAYKILIGKEKGPQLASFILTIGKDKVAEQFKNL